MKRCVRSAMVGPMRGSGRPKKYRTDEIRHDMTHLHLKEDMTL